MPAPPGAAPPALTPEPAAALPRHSRRAPPASPLPLIRPAATAPLTASGYLGSAGHIRGLDDFHRFLRRREPPPAEIDRSLLSVHSRRRTLRARRRHPQRGSLE